MENQYLPLVVGVFMLALGLTLTVADFQRAVALRRPLAVAMICQSLLLPAVCLLIAEAWHLEPKLAVGLLLVSATPGGLMANILSHLVGGDLALNLTLTAINAALSIVALPVILLCSMAWFFGEGRFIPLQFDKFVGVFGLVLIPTAVGIAIRHRFPDRAKRLQRPIKIAAAMLLAIVAIAAITKGGATLWHNLGVLIGAVVSFCVLSLTVGYLAPRVLHLGPRQAIAASLEIGMHNAVVAMGIALSPQLLNSAEMASPAVIYAAIAPLIALPFALTLRRLDPAFRDALRSEIVANDRPAT